MDEADYPGADQVPITKVLFDHMVEQLVRKERRSKDEIFTLRLRIIELEKSIQRLGVRTDAVWEHIDEFVITR